VIENNYRLEQIAGKYNKFEEESIPKILRAVRAAHEAKVAGIVRIEFSDSGGVMTVIHETKKIFK
jgi:hypothetical protein